MVIILSPRGEFPWHWPGSNLIFRDGVGSDHMPYVACSCSFDRYRILPLPTTLANFCYNFFAASSSSYPILPQMQLHRLRPVIVPKPTSLVHFVVLSSQKHSRHLHQHGGPPFRVVVAVEKTRAMEVQLHPTTPMTCSTPSCPG